MSPNSRCRFQSKLRPQKMCGFGFGDDLHKNPYSKCGILSISSLHKKPGFECKRARNPNLNLKTFIEYKGYSPRFATCIEQITIQSAGQVKTAEILSNLMMGYALADTLALHIGEIPRNPVIQPNRLLKSKWPASEFSISKPYFL